MTTAANSRIEEQPQARRLAVRPRRSYVGSLSLLAAVAGAASCRIALANNVWPDAVWLQLAAAGFEAATVGALADWFAVTALFRHPLGLPIPHTAIIPARRAKIVEGIASMVQDEWLSPEVIGARLQRLAPSELIVDWLRDPVHVERLGAPVRDLLRGLARMLTEDEVVQFLDRTMQRQLRELPIDASVGDWLARVGSSDSAAATFKSVALSLANLVRQPTTAESLYLWLDHTARQLRQEGKRLVPLFLRRKFVQRSIVEAACDAASTELLTAAEDPQHALRRWVFGAVQRYAERLAGADPETLQHVEQLRRAIVESLEAAPLVRNLLDRLRRQLEQDLDAPGGYLSGLVDRELRAGIVELLEDPARRAAFDHWVRTTATDLLQRHHHQIGLTVRENLEALDTSALVAQIEDRVGADLQFIRLNGAMVGGAIGVLLALAHRLAG